MDNHQKAVATRVLTFLGDFLRSLGLAGTCGVAYHNVDGEVTSAVVEPIGDKRQRARILGFGATRSRAVAFWKIGTANLCENQQKVLVRLPGVLVGLEGICPWLGWVRQYGFTVAVSAFAEIHDLLVAALGFLSSSDETMTVVQVTSFPDFESRLSGLVDVPIVLVGCQEPERMFGELKRIMGTSRQGAGITEESLYLGGKEEDTVQAQAIFVESLDWMDKRPLGGVGEKVWGVAFVQIQNPS